MPLNLEADKSYYQFDQWNMLVVPSDELSWRDSIGRTVLAWIAYDTPEELEYALDKCWKDGKLYRHPAHNELASRDHHSYDIISMNMFIKQSPAYKNYVKKLPFMRGLYLWMHSLTGNKLAEFFYYFWNIPFARFGNFWLWLCRWTGRIRPERDNNWWIAPWDIPINLNNNGLILLRRRTKWQKLWAWIIFKTIPAYSLHVKAWQIYVMPDSKKKEKLKRILLSRIGISNIMLRLLFGDTTVTQEEIDSYPHLTGYRPGVYLDETCRRNIKEMTAKESEFNSYEKDLIKKLYDEKEN